MKTQIASFTKVFALIAIFALLTSPAFAAKQAEAPAPTVDVDSANGTVALPDIEENACFRVSCDGEYAGLVCGQTVPDIIEGMEELCGLA